MKEFKEFKNLKREFELEMEQMGYEFREKLKAPLDPSALLQWFREQITRSYNNGITIGQIGWELYHGKGRRSTPR